MKKLIASLCAVLACSFLFTATPVQAKTTNYEMTLTKNYQRMTRRIQWVSVTMAGLP